MVCGKDDAVWADALAVTSLPIRPFESFVALKRICFEFIERLCETILYVPRQPIESFLGVFGKINVPGHP